MKDIAKIVSVLLLLRAVAGLLWGILVTLFRVSVWFIRLVFRIPRIITSESWKRKSYKKRMAAKKYHYVYETTIYGHTEVKKYIGKHSSNKHPDKDDYVGSGNFIRKAKKLNELYHVPPYRFKRRILRMCRSSDEAFKIEAELIQRVRNDKTYVNATLTG